MDSDRGLGVLIIIGVIVAGILYFGSFVIPWWSFLAAVKVIVSAGFVLLLIIGGWIGWTMASTPSPEALEDMDLEETEEEPIEFEESAERDLGLEEDLKSIRGMTDPRVQSLMDAGYDSREALEGSSEDDLKGVEGIGPALAERIKEMYS